MICTLRGCVGGVLFATFLLCIKSCSAGYESCVCVSNVRNSIRCVCVFGTCLEDRTFLGCQNCIFVYLERKQSVYVYYLTLKHLLELCRVKLCTLYTFGGRPLSFYFMLQLLVYRYTLDIFMIITYG